MADSLPKRTGRSKKVAQEHFADFTDRCWFCGLEIPEILEIAHIDQDRANDDPDNLALLCPTCHRLLDVGAITQEEVRAAKAEHLKGQRVHGPSPAQHRIALEIRSGNRSTDWGLLAKGAQQRAGETIRRKAAARRAWNTRRKNKE